MAYVRFLAASALSLAAVALAGTPGNRTRVSAQASERSVEDEIAEEHARLHKNVQKAVPASHEKSTVNMWKTARPSAAKVQAAAAVAAGDWADADSFPEGHATSKTQSAYDANADAVEQERASIHKAAQSSPASTERSTATKWKIGKPADAKVQAAAKAAAEDWANADDAKQVRRPAVAKVQAAKAAIDETPFVSKVPNEPTVTEPADVTVQVAKPAAKEVSAAAAVLDGRNALRKVDAGSAKKVTGTLRKRGRH